MKPNHPTKRRAAQRSETTPDVEPATVLRLVPAAVGGKSTATGPATGPVASAGAAHRLRMPAGAEVFSSSGGAMKLDASSRVGVFGAGGTRSGSAGCGLRLVGAPFDQDEDGLRPSASGTPLPDTDSPGAATSTSEAAWRADGLDVPEPVTQSFNAGQRRVLDPALECGLGLAADMRSRRRVFHGEAWPDLERRWDQWLRRLDRIGVFLDSADLLAVVRDARVMRLTPATVPGWRIEEADQLIQTMNQLLMRLGAGDALGDLDAKEREGDTHEPRSCTHQAFCPEAGPVLAVIFRTRQGSALPQMPDEPSS